ncbi:MAG: 30S ribosomal protein S20 [Candidatus Aegiribacteria sp.]|nr:30S ribosomal protein S20 [Candidatus Aegiribacteria sp.]
MARCKQSLKRRRTDIVKAQRNRSKMRELRSAIKSVNESETPEDRVKAMRKAQSLIDKASRKHLLHRNRANRLKHSLM